MDFQNVAVFKSVVQSSTKYRKVATAALDSGAKCAETTISDSPWWRIDLGGEYNVNQVVITSRQGVKGE